ncbi:MAG: LysR family transcriptional regulator [Alphaproteobacteria bacterium]|nr:MAG: LysR family transcriptional regulator [Alphaproteobacteria bacterium]
MARISLEDLQVFLAVAEARGFRGAAERLGQSASTLSDAVRRLESQVGLRLLNRTTRSVTPTDAGASLIMRLGPAFGALDEALDALNAWRDSPTGTLRLNVPGIVARVVLPPIAAAFLAEYPGIRLEVSEDNRFLDVVAAGFDAGVRYEERLERDMIAVPLGPRHQRFATAAAPAYLARHGTPTHPRDLVNHACLTHRFASGVEPAWEFERDGEVVRIQPQGPLASSTIDLQLAAAIAGLGIVSSFEAFLTAPLADGRLVPVLPEWWQPFTGPWLYFPNRRHMPTPLRAFVDFLKRGGVGGG